MGQVRVKLPGNQPQKKYEREIILDADWNLIIKNDLCVFQGGL